VNTRTAVLVYLVPLVLLVASIGAFLTYVSAIGIMSVTAILLGLMLTFALGVVAGGRRIRISRIMRRLHDARWERNHDEHADAAYAGKHS
jgi:hypothetical protein